MALYRPHGPHRPITDVDDDSEYVDEIVDTADTALAADTTPDDSSDDESADQGTASISSIADLATPSPKRRKRVPWQPGVQANGTFLDRIGRVFSEIDDEVLPIEAPPIVKQGAALVWDRCGCGGSCGLFWVPTSRYGELVTSVPVLRYTRRGRGTMSLWKAGDGSQLLLLQSTLVWGRAIR